MVRRRMGDKGVLQRAALAAEALGILDATHVTSLGVQEVSPMAQLAQRGREEPAPEGALSWVLEAL